MFPTELRQHEVPFSGSIRPIQTSDLSLLKPILETWIRDSETHELLTEELESTLQAMEESISGKNDRTYFVAVTQDGNVVGSMGMRTPDPRLLQYVTTGKPIELVNAFVSKDYRRQGTGQALVHTIEKEAKQKGYTELIMDSGPRYKFTG
ncbi:hypothetical protein A2363_00530 [Candidatus Gottesmanbacteria bacterium RIFOXYB1_FULL_47_11]|uniref:N-acetyltransferase domain-containing protein n=1 Tax=Candidatus Gottesmanbacteria bacterium RIFOXYB1_FULL_47_11 TaxID=1798401 RepID=A0A1F6BC85_9BACT|nr:MAG: hypothetical protein A2363_00530 [Candidatus Gottesmanbacteria bacterium RIFOXYB1_FULL_47_11]